MSKVIITEEIEVYQPRSKEYWVRNIINFDAWVNKYKK